MDLASYPEWIGKTVAELKQNLAQLVLAIKRDGEFIEAPNNAEHLVTNDVLIIMRSTKP